jgi:predicted regulator of Ras-like GTPase activity (Roadblock/LC7/MglB family)
MLGLFKKMLSKSHATPPPPARPVVASRPGAVPPPRPRAASGPIRVTPAVKPTAAVTAAAAIPPAPPLSAVPATPNGTHVYVSLGTIAASVPETISHKVPAHHDQFVAIPLEFIVPQLSHGQVVLTTAELRASSTEFFGALTAQDEVSVSLPLSDVVQQVPKEYFVRKNKRKVEVPNEVASVFAPNGQGVSVARTAAATPAAPAPTIKPPQPAYRAHPAVTSTSAQPVPAPTAPAAKISISPQSLAAMKAATAAPTPTVSAPAPRAITPLTPPTPAPAAPAPQPLPRPAAPAPVAKKPASKPMGELAVPLHVVAPEWDQEVRKQLADINLQQHLIHVPLELLAPAMKSGKVLFSWAEVATWIQPPLPSPPTPRVGEMPVELPLKIIAPLFMAKQNSASNKRVAVDETIPDLFGGNGKENGNGHASSNAQIHTPLRDPNAPAAPSMPSAAPARSMTPAAAPLQMSVEAEAETALFTPAPKPAFTPAVTIPAPAPVAPAPEPVAAPATQEVSVETVIGAEGSRFGAKEIVANASRLPGVAGALLAMSDGLLVTSSAPAAVKGETIAAFLPQMFGRMNQYTKELALGPLQQLTLGIESGQWHVVKCPNIYFAVLGKRGEALPLNLLAQVAAELSNQSK